MILLRFKNNYTFTCAFLTACYTGMRTGEVLALTWDDIDLEKQIIKVNKTVYAKKKDDNGRWYLGTTKTEGSCREIFICNTLKVALKNYKEYQESNKEFYRKNYHNYYLEEIKNKYDKIIEYKIIQLKHKSKNRKQVNLVFTKRDGKYCGIDILKYPFKIIHEKLNIKKCRFYHLRGSFATKTLRSGVKIRNVADILGHSKVETIENYYISSLEETMKIASGIFEQTVKSDVINEIIKYLPEIYKE